MSGRPRGPAWPSQRDSLRPALQPAHVFVAVVCLKPGVDLDARRQPPSDRQYSVAGSDLSGDAVFGTDRGNRLLRDPDRLRPNALHEDTFGMAAQHRLAAIAEVTGGDPLAPSRGHGAADVDATGGDGSRADLVRHVGQRADQL